MVDEAERLALAREAMGADAPARRGPPAARPRSPRWPASPAADDPELAGPLARYRAGKRARGLVDLDDLLARPVALLTEDPALAEAYRRRWRHVSVDEYQDVDPAQYALLRLLVPPDGDLCVIGDPDQAIYSFRGADVGFFLRFAADFPARPRGAADPQLPQHRDRRRRRARRGRAGHAGAGPDPHRGRPRRGPGTTSPCTPRPTRRPRPRSWSARSSGCSAAPT